MNAAPLLVALLLSGADDLTAVTHGRLQVQVPKGWTHERGSDRWDAPSKKASFELSVFPVQPQRDGKVCLGQLLEALGGQGWSELTVGGAPAARKVSTEKSRPEGNEAPVEVETHSYVGCNGSTKWVLTLTASAGDVRRYGSLANKMVASIRYK